jgi:hypothetical protein
MLLGPVLEGLPINSRIRVLHKSRYAEPRYRTYDTVMGAEPPLNCLTSALATLQNLLRQLVSISEGGEDMIVCRRLESSAAWGGEGGEGKGRGGTCALSTGNHVISLCFFSSSFSGNNFLRRGDGALCQQMN